MQPKSLTQGDTEVRRHTLTRVELELVNENDVPDASAFALWLEDSRVRRHRRVALCEESHIR